MIAWARTHAPHVDGRAETDKFVDYWRAQPGQRGRKSDWEATWRNWMRRAQEHHTRSGSGSAWSAAGLAASTAPQPLTPEQTCRQHRGQRADRCRHCRAARIGAADDD